MSRKRLFPLVFLVLFAVLRATLTHAGGQKEVGTKVEGGHISEISPDCGGEGHGFQGDRLQ